MHLGRFHATVYDLTEHFSARNIPEKLEECAVALDNYAQARDSSYLTSFRTNYEALLKSIEISDPDLKQPYAQQIILELAIADILDPIVTKHIQEIITNRAFDHAGIAADFRVLAEKIKKRLVHITNIDKSFSALKVEFERVDGLEAEVGILLPREVVGSSLSALTSEFTKLGKLFRAINELTGAHEYDPKVRTISSSWWQLFLELDAVQVLVWVTAIERIVTLFKSNLEIKVLQQTLAEKNIPSEITDMIEKEIDLRVKTSLHEIASDLRKEHAKIQDEGRLNEVETQLRQGLHHLAMRINQGSQVEINVGIPDEPTDQPELEEGQELDQNLLCQIEAQRAKIALLRDLRTRCRAASAETMEIDTKSPILLQYLSEHDATELKQN